MHTIASTSRLGRSDERHRQIDEREQRRRQLRVGDLRLREHQRRVVEDRVDPRELHADLDHDAEHIPTHVTMISARRPAFSMIPIAMTH